MFLQGRVVGINMQRIYPTRIYSFRYKLILQNTLFHFFFSYCKLSVWVMQISFFSFLSSHYHFLYFLLHSQIKSNFRFFGSEITLELLSRCTIVACCLRSGFSVSNGDISAIWITASRSVHNNLVYSSIILLNHRFCGSHMWSLSHDKCRRGNHFCMLETKKR